MGPRSRGLVSWRRASLDRVNLTRKGDFALRRPMMRIWGKGSGLRPTASCVLRRGRVSRVRDVNRCRRAFATSSLPGQKGQTHATMTNAWPLFGGGGCMTRRAQRATESYREFEIRSGRRTMTTRYSSSALQAAKDHLRAFGSSDDEVRVLGPDTVSWRGARFVAVPVRANSRP